jgi:hypothetical protein
MRTGPVSLLPRFFTFYRIEVAVDAAFFFPFSSILDEALNKSETLIRCSPTSFPTNPVTVVGVTAGLLAVVGMTTALVAAVAVGVTVVGVTAVGVTVAGLGVCLGVLRFDCLAVSSEVLLIEMSPLSSSGRGVVGAAPRAIFCSCCHELADIFDFLMLLAGTGEEEVGTTCAPLPPLERLEPPPLLPHPLLLLWNAKGLE